MKYLEHLRRYELDLVLPQMTAGSKILEIGAGAGWQAQVLAEKGYLVEAVDTEGSCYEPERIRPVALYDGHTLPYPNETFDIVFTSNVLEHIPHVEEFQNEIQRVLKRAGIAIHVLPSASWRFWTSVAYYVNLTRETMHVPARFRGKLYHLRDNRYPPRHGDRGNSFTELYLFSRRAWLKLFMATGWVVENTYANKIFYTGYDIFNLRLPLRVRRCMSYALGSSCNIICLRKSTGLGGSAK